MRLQVIVGGLFGSEAKGHVAGYLASDNNPIMAIRVAGPNAGHSVVNPKTGVKHALRQIPVAMVTDPNAVCCIAAGSEVDIEVLANEIDMLEEDGINIRGAGRLKIDPSATILTAAHKADELAASLTDRIGSTGKGIGAARAARLMRTAARVADYQLTLSGEGVDIVPIAEMVQYMPNETTVQIEGTQGYGLGLHTAYYPQVTSSDCRAIDFMAMAGMNPWWFEGLEIWVVVRPYPIRVAGNSGPLHEETTWDALGLPPEYTTVTKKMRRVGRWDTALVRAAIQANGGYTRSGVRDPLGAVHLALTMADQLDPQVAGVTHWIYNTGPVEDFMSMIRTETGYMPELITTSDRTVIDRRS